METRDRLFIGNEWVAPATDRTIDVISPITEEVYARTPDGSPADIDRAVAAAREAFDNGPWPNSTPEERADAIAALSQALQKRGAQIADVVTNENGAPASAVVGDAGVRGDDGPRHLRRHRAQLSVERRARRRHGPEGGGAPGARRRLRGHHPVERAAVHHGDEARAVPRVGLDDGAQAGARDGARPVPARRRRARGRPSARRGQHRHRIARGERAHRHPPRRRQGQLHRFDRDGRAHRRTVRRADQARDARAGRQVRGDPPRRRRPRGATAEHHHVGADEQRAGLRRADPHPGAAARATRRWSTHSPPASARCRSATPTIPPPPSVRLWPNGNATRSSECWSRARSRAPRWRSAAAPRRIWTRAGSSSRRSSTTSTTRCASRAKRSSARCCRSFPYETEDDAVRIANDSDYGLSGSVWTADVDHGAEVAARLRTGTVPVNSATAPRLQVTVRRLQEVGPRPRVRPRGRRPLHRVPVDHLPELGDDLRRSVAVQLCASSKLKFADGSAFGYGRRCCMLANLWGHVLAALFAEASNSTPAQPAVRVLNTGMRKVTATDTRVGESFGKYELNATARHGRNGRGVRGLRQR